MIDSTKIVYPDQEKPHPAFQVHKVLDAGFVRLVDEKQARKRFL